MTDRTMAIMVAGVLTGLLAVLFRDGQTPLNVAIAAFVALACVVGIVALRLVVGE